MHTRNSTGLTVWICTALPDADDWDSGTWKMVMARVMILPEKVGVEDVNIANSELLATNMGEELLPPGLNAISTRRGFSDVAPDISHNTQCIDGFQQSIHTEDTRWMW